MSKDPTPRRPRLALPCTILTAPDTVRLVAGEDFRYTLSGPGVEHWLPAFFANLDGSRSLEDALALLSHEHRDLAVELTARLYGERVLVDGPARAAHPARACRLAVEGSGPLREALSAAAPADGEVLPPLPVLCQDCLDYDEALRFNRRCRADGSPWLWASTGPLSRGYVGPLFLPDAGPCLACLLSHFQRLSPAPEIYDDLLAHARQGLPVAPAPFPAQGVAVLEALVRWKAELLAERDPPAALYRLHVLELESMEVSAHRVLADPECPECIQALSPLSPWRERGRG
jgi:bacteriocin biosynthesis cyclodehydratase domain-containing protein